MGLATGLQPPLWMNLLGKPRLPLGRGILLGLVCAVAAWGAFHTPPLRSLEDWLQDSCLASRGVRPTRTPVVLIGLDDVSLDELRKPVMYVSPELAEVVSFVKGQGAAAIGLDLIVPESLLGFAGLEAGQPGDATKLGQAIQQAGNVVLAEWKLGDRWLRPLPQWRWKHLLDPRPTDLGFVNLTEDADQFVRQQQLIIRDGEEFRLHFALALFAAARKAEATWDAGGLQVDGIRVHLDADQKMRINFVGPPGSFPIVPFRAALAAARGTQQLGVDLTDAIVIIGLTTQSGQDYHATPYANNTFPLRSGSRPLLMTGSEIHGHIVATLNDRATIFRVPWSSSLLLLLVCGPLLGKLFSWLNLEAGVLVAVAHHLSWLILCWSAFRYACWRIDMVPMLLLGLLAYTATFTLRWSRLRYMMGVMKSEAIARALEADPRQLDRRGEERVITVLFADIRGFTAFSEGHSPREAVALLNAYFSVVVPVIEANGGTVNSYLGDGVLALFGAPASSADHALQAVRAAVAMVRAVHQRSTAWAALGKPGFAIGVGIHTGKVIVGTVGSPRRLDYTAIGDTTNAAARIEAENKRLSTEILISSETYQALPPEQRPLLGCVETPQPATVKGKQQTLYLHTVRVS